MVVGDDGTNGGLWCSPVANTSSPTSSALRAMATVALIRSASVGARPVVGSVRDVADREDPELHDRSCSTPEAPGWAPLSICPCN